MNEAHVLRAISLSSAVHRLQKQRLCFHQLCLEKSTLVVGIQSRRTLLTVNRSAMSDADSWCDHRTRRSGFAPGPLELCSPNVMLGHESAEGGQPFMEVPQPSGLICESIQQESYTTVALLRHARPKSAIVACGRAAGRRELRIR